MKYLSLLLLLVSSFTVSGQDTIDVPVDLLGSWEGAFIKENSYQKIAIDFYRRDNQLYTLQMMDEWYPTFGEFEVPARILENGQIAFGTGYGLAELTLDPNNLEMVGQLDGFNPAIYVHLKRVADRPAPNYMIEEVTIPSSDKINLYGHLHLPTTNPVKTAIILVGGRGCGADATRYNLYAKFLRSYGVAVLAYQKRGTGNSTGDCSLATIADLAEDVVSAAQFLSARLENFENIGVLGISAGGWVMTKAQTMNDFDFMASVVGPATSVEEQQQQSMEYGANFFQLPEDARTGLREYLELMFRAAPNETDYDRMQELLSQAEDQGWRGLLEGTDIPAEVQEIDQLWVRRHQFDPKPVLGNYQQPFFAIYGERDWIVPPAENVRRLEELFADRPELLTIAIAYNAEHGMEMETRYVELDNNQSYWHFYRISPQLRIELVNFLRKHQLID